jgi:hypothetical protein
MILSPYINGLPLAIIMLLYLLCSHTKAWIQNLIWKKK